MQIFHLTCKTLTLLYVCAVVSQSDQEVPDMDEDGILLGVDMLVSPQLEQQQLSVSGMYCI